MNNNITIFDNLYTVIPFPQIDLFAPGNPDIFFQNSFFEKLIDYLGSKKTCASGDEIFLSDQNVIDMSSTFEIYDISNFSCIIELLITSFFIMHMIREILH